MRLTAVRLAVKFPRPGDTVPEMLIRRPSRRQALQLGGAAALSIRCASELDLHLADNATYDEVLDALHDTDFEFGDDFSNHASMAADALVAAGRPERVIPFLRGYTTRLHLRDQAPPLTDAAQAAALGNYKLREEWAATYEQALLTMTPRALLAQQWPRLVHGWRALHGVLRTAHAARALDREDTPSRRREFAQGLGYWAARHETLPGTPGAKPVAGLDVMSALTRITPIPRGEQKHGGLINPRFAPLAKHPEFNQVIEAVDLSAQPVDVALSVLVGASARMMVNGEGRYNIALLHGVTVTAALRLLLPWLDPEAQRLGLGRAFQVVAALFAAQTESSAVFNEVPAASMTAAGLLAIATDDGEEHSFKLTEAAVREHAISGRPELLAVAQAYLT